MSGLTRGERLELVEEQVQDLMTHVDFLSQFIDLSRFNHVQVGGMRGIPAEALVEHELEQNARRAEFDPIHNIVQQFAHCNTKAETEAVMEQYRIAVDERDERERKLTEEMNAYLAGDD